MVLDLRLNEKIGLSGDNLLFLNILMSAFGSYKISKIINRKLPIIMIFQSYLWIIGCVIQIYCFF